MGRVTRHRRLVVSDDRGLPLFSQKSVDILKRIELRCTRAKADRVNARALAGRTSIDTHRNSGALENTCVFPEHHFRSAAGVVAQDAKTASQKRDARCSESRGVDHRQLSGTRGPRFITPAKASAMESSPSPMTTPPQQRWNPACAKARSDVR